MERNQFTFYRSYYEALKHLPKRDQTSVLLALIGYALDEQEPSLSGVALSVFTLTARRWTMAEESGKSAEQNKIKRRTNREQTEIKTGTNRQGERE